MRSKNYDKIKWYYDQKFWSEKKVRDAVTKKLITEEEFKMITGKDF